MAPIHSDPGLAADAAASARVRIACLESLDELAGVDGLFADIWGASGSQVAMPVNLLRAISHSGGYVAGAFRDAELVGAAVGFLGQHDGVAELHSHVVGVARSEQGGGVGYALKLHQRDWAAGRGLRRVTWTFDPLIRRNGRFNLARLGARAVAYYPDFYGPMIDELNGADETDRCLAEWDVAGGRPADPPGADAADLLVVASGGTPAVCEVPKGAHVLACQVPADVVALRRGDPGLAREWRLALRHTMGRAMQDGYRATYVTDDGRYLLEPPPS